MGSVTHRVQIDGLARQQVRLAEKAAGPVPDHLVAVPVQDRRLARQDRDQRVPPVADPEEDVADRGRPLLAVLGEQVQLRLREHRTHRTRHPSEH